MATNLSTASVLTVEELTGQKRKLELRGGGLPKRGAAWEGEQKLTTKWYPGNAGEATQHVLGPVELPSDWEGTWRTTQLIRTPAKVDGASVTVASDLAAALDSIRYFGALLKVTWAQDLGRRIVRVGRIQKFKHAYDRMDDVAWSATFVWVGRGAPPQSVVAFKQDSPTSGMNQAVLACNALLQKVQAAPFLASDPSVPGSATTHTLGLSFSLAAGPAALVASLTTSVAATAGRIGQVVDLMQQAGSVPPQLTSQAADVASTATATMVDFTDRMGQVPAELMTTWDDRVSTLAVAVGYFWGLVDGADGASGATAQMEAQLRRRQSGLRNDSRRKDRVQAAEVLAVVVARKGDTFVSLSLRHYQSPDLAADIARSNGFPGYQVAPPRGKILVLPKSFGTDARDTV